MPVKYTNDDIINITSFENITKSQVMDYLKDDNTLYFVIKSDNFMKLIGRDGVMIKEIKRKMNQNLILYKYSENLEEFTKNLMPVPVKKFDLTEHENSRTITVEIEKRNKGLLIGRGGKTINIIKTFLKRQFNIDNIKIV